MAESFEPEREYFGHGLRRKDKDIRERVGKIVEGEASGKERWPICDSPLSHSQPGFIPYEVTFSPLIAQERGSYEEGGQDLKEYIEDILVGGRGKAIGIDFGGQGSKVFQGFEEQFFRRTLGVTLKDERDEEEKEIDEDNRHDVIAGNMFEPRTRGRIKEWLRGERVDLIFERMWGGLKVINHDIRFVREVLKQIYAILREGGIIFVEHDLGSYHGSLEIFYRWANYINEKYTGKVRVVLDSRFPDEYGKPGGEFLIRKLKGAPKQLPGTELLRKSAEEDLEPKQSIGTE